MDGSPAHRDSPRKPLGLKWRSSVWFITAVVTLGMVTDLLVYSMVIPVLPFHLQELGYGEVSGKVGWLLFAYSGGLVAATIPTALLSEWYINRKYPLLFGQIFIIGSQVMLMEARHYSLMLVARIIQGISSSVIWVVGLALICDTTPENLIGMQLGIAMSGVSIGFLTGPPVGGALYSAFGYRGPFVFGIIFGFVDLIGRLSIIERREAQSDDPTSAQGGGGNVELMDVVPSKDLPPESKESPPSRTEVIEHLPPRPIPSQGSSRVPAEAVDLDRAGVSAQTSLPEDRNLSRINMVGILKTLTRSPRALVSLLDTLLFGIILASQEPTLPLHLQHVWRLTASKVGVVYIASVVPSLFSGPLAGWCTDRWGPEWVTVLCLLLAIPWMVLMSLEKSLALFITSFSLTGLSIAGVVSPITADLAAVARKNDGLGYAHVYGAFNLFYGIGSALGPIIGGQIYDHSSRGWLAICLVSVGLACICAGCSACYIGDRPLLGRLKKRARAQQVSRSFTQHSSSAHGLSRGR